MDRTSETKITTTQGKTMKKRIITLGIIGFSLAMVLPVQGLNFPAFHFLFSGQVELKRFGSNIFQKTQAPIKLNHQDLLRVSQPQKARILCFGHKLSPLITEPEIAVKDVCISRPETREGGFTIPETRHPKSTDPTIPYIISPRRTALLTNRPTLIWNAVAETDFYEVKLIGPGINWKTQTDKNSIVYSGEKPLQTNAKYTLIIKTDKNKSSQNDRSFSDGISFSVLPEEKVEEIEKTVQDLDNKELTPEMKGLAIAYFYQGENLKAEAIEVLEKLIQQETVGAEVYRTLGELYQETSLNSWAKDRYEKAWELIKNQTNEIEKQALIQVGLGETHWGEGDSEKALEWLSLAKANYERLNLAETSNKIEKRMEEITTGN
ncbi:tetratricopeptide repeat protein [Crocosphaera sp. Alani8]|uniref:tetratricopeptide repeat protein n=1 Tax=Crocosphaera sp. Alani8 TaxID=3038952 RepID=UPI00313BE212